MFQKIKELLQIYLVKQLMLLSRIFLNTFANVKKKKKNEKYSTDADLKIWQNSTRNALLKSYFFVNCGLQNCKDVYCTHYNERYGYNSRIIKAVFTKKTFRPSSQGFLDSARLGGGLSVIVLCAFRFRGCGPKHARKRNVSIPEVLEEKKQLTSLVWNHAPSAVNVAS
ncbi:hypothetical protein TNCV_4191561 [Trichonephila clavipes]|nr:hypothetical protein TNCV_4191561 [Trichonephila clavipes]